MKQTPETSITPPPATVFEAVRESNPYSTLGRPALTGYEGVAATVFENVGTTPADGEIMMGSTGTPPDPFEPEPEPEPQPDPMPPHP